MSLTTGEATSLQNTSALRGNAMKVKVHTRESHPSWHVLFWTWIKEHCQDRQLLELPKSKSLSIKNGICSIKISENGSVCSFSSKKSNLDSREAFFDLLKLNQLKRQKATLFQICYSYYMYYKNPCGKK